MVLDLQTLTCLGILMSCGGSRRFPAATFLPLFFFSRQALIALPRREWRAACRLTAQVYRGRRRGRSCLFSRGRLELTEPRLAREAGGGRVPGGGGGGGGGGATETLPEAAFTVCFVTVESVESCDAVWANRHLYSPPITLICINSWNRSHVQTNSHTHTCSGCGTGVS